MNSVNVFRDLIIRLYALYALLKDLHYRFTGESFSGNHMLMDRLLDILEINDTIDQIQETCLLGAGHQSVPYQDIIGHATMYVPVLADAKELDVSFVIEHVESTIQLIKITLNPEIAENGITEGDKNLLGGIAQNLQQVRGLLLRMIKDVEWKTHVQLPVEITSFGMGKSKGPWKKGKQNLENLKNDLNTAYRNQDLREKKGYPRCNMEINRIKKKIEKFELNKAQHQRKLKTGKVVMVNDPRQKQDKWIIQQNLVGPGGKDRSFNSGDFVIGDKIKFTDISDGKIKDGKVMGIGLKAFGRKDNPETMLVVNKNKKFRINTEDVVAVKR